MQIDWDAGKWSWKCKFHARCGDSFFAFGYFPSEGKIVTPRKFTIVDDKVVLTGFGGSRGYLEPTCVDKEGNSYQIDRIKPVGDLDMNNQPSGWFGYTLKRECVAEFKRFMDNEKKRVENLQKMLDIAQSV